MCSRAAGDLTEQAFDRAPLQVRAVDDEQAGLGDVVPTEQVVELQDRLAGR